ncbi:hypothetical protein ACGFNU_38825 [Spirillospora sp. NPDC048911]|uniref:hypothetical protein n=1 Tax=Spirillospora sp. NPDC048911 TaxID=3364527 RepID=UPI0037193A2F
MTTSSSPASPFSRIKIRVGALVFCGDEVALIRALAALHSPRAALTSASLPAVTDDNYVWV